MNCKIDPFIRYIAKSTYFIPGKFLIAGDCRMLYTVSGKASFETLNKVYSLSPGTLIYYPAGTPYKIMSEENEKFLFYTVNFDFSCDFNGGRLLRLLRRVRGSLLLPGHRKFHALRLLSR